MPLSAGARIGPYEILAPLGAGGMGEVYKARDSKLGRELALKVLPTDLSMDADRLKRFEQEARSASALNHPNIVTIYEIGQVDTTSYIAMELVSGRTLRDILAEGPLPLRRFLAVAAPIADGLARAHEAGIVHRDVKPENVMVTREGVAKILDFGLAKLVTSAESAVSQLVTVSGTRPGLVLGTIGYMSPEQASGTTVDYRSDQFSFGALLYEMATARRPFSRNTGAETLAAVIRDDPEPLQSQAPQLPVALRWVIERCLAKDPEERYASTRDLARDLAHLRDHVSEASQGVAVAAPSRRRQYREWALGAGWIVAAAAGIAALALFSRSAPQPAPLPVRFAVPVPAGTTYAPSEVSRGFSISPNGTTLVIEAFSKGRRHLYVRRLDSEKTIELEGSADATSHFWSPDSRFLAFFADGKLKKIPAGGGRPQDLCAAPFAVIGTWSPDGSILFSGINPPGIYRVPETGGDPVRVFTPDTSRNEMNIWPHFLPDGRRFLYIASVPAATENRELRMASLDSKENRTISLIARATSRIEYAPPGYLLYVRDGALFAQPFDERNARLHGEIRQLASDVHFFIGPSHAAFSASATGAIAYQTGAAPSRLAWFTRDGREVGQLGEPSVVRGIRISPDGARVAMDVRNNQTGSADIWVVDIGGGVSTRLHSDSLDEIMPVWSADGSKLIYRSDASGPPDVYELALATPGSEKPILALPGVQQPEDVTRNGRWLAYLSEVATTVWNVWLLPLDGQSKPVPWLRSRFNHTSPRFSPDGRWIAYESNESGDPEIYVALTDGGGQKRRISPTGGRRPAWRGDGKELYYAAPDGSVMAVPVTSGVQWTSGAPVLLFRAQSEIQNYDVTTDGSRFLIAMPLAKTPESPLRVILNWPALLKSEK